MLRPALLIRHLRQAAHLTPFQVCEECLVTATTRHGIKNAVAAPAPLDSEDDPQWGTSGARAPSASHIGKLTQLTAGVLGSVDNARDAEAKRKSILTKWWALGGCECQHPQVVEKDCRELIHNCCNTCGRSVLPATLQRLVQQQAGIPLASSKTPSYFSPKPDGTVLKHAAVSIVLCSMFDYNATSSLSLDDIFCLLVRKSGRPRSPHKVVAQRRKEVLQRASDADRSRDETNESNKYAYRGQMALPGGFVDMAQDGLCGLKAALREMSEEVGLSWCDHAEEDAVTLLGEMPTFQPPHTDSAISPFVFWWRVPLKDVRASGTYGGRTQKVAADGTYDLPTLDVVKSGEKQQVAEAHMAKMHQMWHGIEHRIERCTAEVAGVTLVSLGDLFRPWQHQDLDGFPHVPCDVLSETLGTGLADTQAVPRHDKGKLWGITYHILCHMLRWMCSSKKND